MTKTVDLLTRLLGYLSCCVLFIMMLLTVADVSARYFFNSPITGTTEICELMMVVVVFPALGWAALAKAHVRVDLLVGRLPRRAQAVIATFTLLLALFIYVILSWRSGLESMVVSRQSSLLELPFTPFYWIMTAGFAIFCIAIIVLIIENIKEALKR